MSVGVVKLALSLVKIQLTNLTYIDSSGVVAKKRNIPICCGTQGGYGNKATVVVNNVFIHYMPMSKAQLSKSH